MGWIGSFLSGRTGRTRFKEGTMEPFGITAGIPQGSPLSPILWLLYNHKALKVAEDEEALVTGYIDDTCILVTGDDTRTNSTQLDRIHSRLGGWVKQHGAVFVPQKYELIHFYWQPKEVSEEQQEASVTIHTETTTQEIGPVGSARYLGIWIDSRLTTRHTLRKH